MSYRIEISANNRAGCQDKVCKDAKTKITKGELRFGVWFVMPNTEHGSWKWRHWGCVSGKTISNLQESLQKDDGYDWDMLDGYDEIDDPEIKEKIRRVVKQGHIDAEDFNGDPEFNVPGKTAIRGRAKKPKADDDDDEADEDVAIPKKAAPKKAAGVKRGRKKAVEEEEETEEEAQPVKKKAKAGRKAKKADGEEEEIQPVKKARASRKSKKDEEGEEENEEVKAPVKKTKGGRKAKQLDENVNENVEEPEEPAPAKKGRGRKAAAKKAPSPPPTDEEDEDEEPIVKKASVTKNVPGRKSASGLPKAAPKGGRRRVSKGKTDE
ncbi:hypothetical protein F5X98DRAFT_322014 [Xylaria grammica]|nr:hypothetical protein F5X98DRAFT_322014 [Xylaria grammica]